MRFLTHAFRHTGIVTAGLMLAALWSGVAAAADKQPNIVFIFSDDHAAHALSCYDSKINKTPNLDRIANEGMLFENCFCTNSICGPSRAVILTGKYSHLNGFPDNRSRFDGSQLTFPKLLQKAGYSTAMVGKWHLVSNPTGFDYWKILIGQGPYYNPEMIENGEKVKHTGYTTDIITDLALDYLKNERDKDKPFLLMYQHKAPHRNWEPGPKYLTMYDDVEIPEPDNLFDDYSGRTSAAHTQEMSVANDMYPYDVKLMEPRNFTPEQLAQWNAVYKPIIEDFKQKNLKGKELTKWLYQRYIKDYLRCVASVDDNVGRVLDYLDEAGLTENTIVVYSSDQGFYLGDHGWYDKRFMYEESLRMPLMVRWPAKVKPGSRNTDLVSNVDFAETFLDAAGIKIPSEMQGRSLVPLLEGHTPSDWRKSFYYQYYEYPSVHMVRRHYGVRTDRYKLIHFYNADEWELFDLEKDPREMQSVYNNTEYRGIQDRLKAEIKRLQKELRVPEDTEKIPKEAVKREPPKDPDYIKTVRQLQEGG